MALIDPGRIRFALPFAIGHWFLLVLFQCEDLLRYLPPKSAPSTTPARFLLGLPLRQTENLLASAVVGLVGCLLSGRRVSRWVMLVLWGVLSCYLVLDQVYYTVFFDHFRLSSIEGAEEIYSAALLGSIVSELDLLSLVNSLVVIGWLALLVQRCVIRPQTAGPPLAWRRAWLISGGATVLLVVGIPIALSSTYGNVLHHPLLVLAHDATRGSLLEELRREAHRPRNPLPLRIPRPGSETRG